MRGNKYKNRNKDMDKTWNLLRAQNIFAKQQKCKKQKCKKNKSKEEGMNRM